MYSAHKKIYVEMGLLMFVICIIAAMFFVPQLLTTKNKFTSLENQNLTKVAAGGCSYDSGKNYAQGDTVNSRDGKITPGSTPEAYDMSRYEFIKLSDGKLDISSAYDNVPDHNGAVEPQMGSILGFNAKSAVAAYYLKDKGGQQKYPILEFATTTGADIKIPVSGYNTLYGLDSKGSGPEGNVMWASNNAIAFQIGRADDVSKNYWIYIKDVCVDQALLRAYQVADAGGRRTLPEVYAGDVVAKASGNVQIGIRDSGSFIELRHTRLWAGSWSASAPAPAADATTTTGNGSTGGANGSVGGSNGSTGGSQVASPEANLTQCNRNEACQGGTFCNNCMGFFCNGTSGTCSQVSLNTFADMWFKGRISNLPKTTRKLTLRSIVTSENDTSASEVVTIEVDVSGIFSKKIPYTISKPVYQCAISFYVDGIGLSDEKFKVTSCKNNVADFKEFSLPDAVLKALGATNDPVSKGQETKYTFKGKFILPADFNLALEQTRVAVQVFDGADTILAAQTIKTDGTFAIDEVPVNFIDGYIYLGLKTISVGKQPILYSLKKYATQTRTEGKNVYDFGTISVSSDTLNNLINKTTNQVVYVYPAAQSKNMSSSDLATFSATKNVKTIVESVDGSSVNADFVDIDGAGNITVKFTTQTANFELKSVKTLDSTGRVSGFSLVQNSKL